MKNIRSHLLMNEQSRKWTRGKWAVTEDDGQIVVMRDNYYVATCHAFAFDPGATLTGDADLAAAFIVDAFKVENETGLTPRQLAERVVELEGLLRRIVTEDDNCELDQTTIETARAAPPSPPPSSVKAREIDAFEAGYIQGHDATVEGRYADPSDAATDYLAALSAPEPMGCSLPPIGRDEHYDRDYITLPAGWEIQTKGKGSSFRICRVEGDGESYERWLVTDEHLHPVLERMAREIRNALEPSK